MFSISFMEYKLGRHPGRSSTGRFVQLDCPSNFLKASLPGRGSLVAGSVGGSGVATVPETLPIAPLRNIGPSIPAVSGQPAAIDQS